MKKLLLALLFAPLVSFAQYPIAPIPAGGGFPPPYKWTPIPGMPPSGGTNIYNYYITTNVYVINNYYTTNIGGSASNIFSTTNATFLNGLNVVGGAGFMPFALLETNGDYGTMYFEVDPTVGILMASKRPGYNYILRAGTADAGNVITISTNGIELYKGQYWGNGGGLTNLNVSVRTNTYTVSSIGGGDPSFGAGVTNLSTTLTVTLPPGTYSFVGGISLEGFTGPLPVKFSLNTTASISAGQASWSCITLQKDNYGSPIAPLMQSAPVMSTIAAGGYFPFFSTSTVGTSDVLTSYIFGQFNIGSTSTISVAICPTGAMQAIMMNSWVTFNRK